MAPEKTRRPRGERPAPGLGRMYQRCLTEHEKVPGAPCMACERSNQERHAAAKEGRSCDDRQPVPFRRAFLADHPAFARLARESARLGIPRSFDRDLWDWDRFALAKMHEKDMDLIRDAAVSVAGQGERAFVNALQVGASRPFLYALRELGTSLLWVSPDVSESQKHIKMISESFGKTGAWFYWDGVELIPLPEPTYERETCLERLSAHAAEVALREQAKLEGRSLVRDASGRLAIGPESFAGGHLGRMGGGA